MSERKLFVLGTASQVPTRQRNHNSYFLRWDEEGILIDPGEGTQRQMIHAGISVSEITKILITHFHGDHCLGLAGVIQRLSLDKVNHAIHIYYPASGQIYYEHLQKASNFYNIVTLHDHPVSSTGVIFENDKITMETKPLDHTVDTWGYRLKERDDYTMLPDKLSQFGVKGPLIKELKSHGQVFLGGRTISLKDVSTPRPGQIFAFIMDTRLCPAAFDLAHSADLLVCVSTYLSDRTQEAKKYGHLTAADAATIAKKAGAKKLVLSHFSQRYASTKLFMEEAQVIHPNVIAAEDGEQIAVPKRHRGLR